MRSGCGDCWRMERGLNVSAVSGDEVGLMASEDSARRRSYRRLHCAAGIERERQRERAVRDCLTVNVAGCLERGRAFE